MPGKAIQNEEAEHTAVVDNIGKFIAYNRGNKTSADLTPKIAEHLSRDKSFMGSIWLPEPEALKMHGDKYALTDEALEYARKILKGGTLIHNHPEPDSPLSSTDIMTALKLNLKRVEAICINGREYVLELERPLSPEGEEDML